MVLGTVRSRQFMGGVGSAVIILRGFILIKTTLLMVMKFNLIHLNPFGNNPFSNVVHLFCCFFNSKNLNLINEHLYVLLQYALCSRLYRY